MFPVFIDPDMFRRESSETFGAHPAAGVGDGREFLLHRFAADERPFSSHGAFDDVENGFGLQLYAKLSSVA
ncbi:MAG TPA: hypothetical protein VHG93_20210 [Longimicrobium sp.]|nr:hypothetical protein [Longimicrobium sp.]